VLEQPRRNLLQFLAEEHACELVSVHKHPLHLHLFTAVDGLFQAPIPYCETPPGLGTVSQLYLLVQYQLYAAMSSSMRLHQSEAYSSTRVAIDATLSAYRIIEKPELHALYQARDYSFQTVARFMKRERTKNPLSFPLAGEMLVAWDHCSQFGSHADVSSFFYRMETLPDIDDASKQMLQFMFFQQPENDALAALHYSELLHTFMLMCEVFDPFVRDSARGFDHSGWSRARCELTVRVVTQWRSDMDSVRSLSRP